MAGFELMTAIQYDIPVVWVIFNNGEFNVIKKFLLNIFGDQAFMQFTNPDFVRLTESFGALGLRAKTPDELRSALDQGFSANRPTVIEVPVDTFPEPFELLRPTASR